MQKLISNLEELSRAATDMAAALLPLTDRATLVTLSGDLGAGKTAFTKAVAQAFGVEEVVTSPTFVLEKIYQLQNQKFARLIHIDAYRLDAGADMQALGFDEAMRDSHNLILLEWPERVAEVLPPADIHITITVLPDQSRELEIRTQGTIEQ